MLQPKDTDWLNGYKNKTDIYAVYKKPSSDLETDIDSLNGYKNKTHIYMLSTRNPLQT